MIDINRIPDEATLLRESKWLEGKTLAQVSASIRKIDKDSRVLTKAGAGYVIENGFFGIGRNSDSAPDLPKLGIEIKTCPLKYDTPRKRLSVKEPLSLNIINYEKEHLCNNLKESSLYKKNRKVLFIWYLHDKAKKRSEYIVKYVFLWEMTDSVLAELEPDYQKILKFIREGKAHEIHQSQHEFLTLCPKHNGDFKDPNDRISKRRQPFSDAPAEVRAFRLKNRYMNLVISRYLGKPLGKGGWLEKG